jgi:hypothetical protein
LQCANVVDVNDGVEDHGHPRVVVSVLEAVKRLIEREMADDIECYVLSTGGQSRKTS